MVSKSILDLALSLYLQEAYARAGGAVPAPAQQKLDALRTDPAPEIPDSFFEPAPTLAGNAMAIRLGQPLYPHMKLVVEFCGSGASGPLFRVDAHDMHLHAPPGSPDAAWLQKIRESNKELSDRIEAAWTAAGVPTFKTFLRKTLEERKRKAT